MNRCQTIVTAYDTIEVRNNGFNSIHHQEKQKQFDTEHDTEHVIMGNELPDLEITFNTAIVESII